MTNPSQLVTRCLADVTAKPVHWLWQDRIPLGTLTALEGHPGTGKSTFTLELAACITTGTPLPGGPQIDPAPVLLLSAEDSLESTILPRFQAAGGDPALFHAVEGIAVDDQALQFVNLGRDAGIIRDGIEQSGARLLVIDPWSAYVGSTNTYKDSEVRGLLAPLAKVADETGCAILIVRHLTKATTATAITAGGGSIGIIGACRSGMLLARDPDNEGQLVLAMVKSNLAPQAPALSLQLEQVTPQTARIRWLGSSHYSADALVSSPTGEEKSALDSAKDFLRDALLDGPQPAKDVLKAAKDTGLAERTLQRAADILVKRTRQGFGKGATYLWSLRPMDAKGNAGAISPISMPDGIHGGNEAVSPSVITSLYGCHGPGIHGGAAHGSHAEDRPPCPTCGGRTLRRQSGVYRCPRPECCGPSARDPFIEVPAA